MRKGKRIPFIGHKGDLEKLVELLEDWEQNYIISIDGPGGIGKTRILQEIHTLFQQRGDEKSPVKAVEILDFDEQRFRSPRNLFRHIAQLIDSDTFTPYLQAQQEYRDMETSGVQPDALDEYRRSITECFVKCFNIFSKGKRILLFFDTTDHLELHRGVLKEFVKIGLRLHNFACLLAGRNAESLANFLSEQNIQNIHTISLSPLTHLESASYLEYKQQVLHLSIESHLLQKLIVLAEGRPILLDLAVEWLARQIPMDWLGKELFPVTPIDAQKQEFEQQLVKQIALVRTPMDKLILIMGHVYPLNIEMISYFIKDKDPSALFHEATSYVFVKRLPDNYITLHDEMRRMVRQYVLPENNPNVLSRLRNYSRIAAQYFEEKIQNIEQQRQYAKSVNEIEIDEYIHHADLLNLRNILMMKQVYHALFSDIEMGFDTYARTLWKLRHEKSTSAAWQIQELVKEDAPKFSETQYLQYEVQQARLISDRGNPQKAQKLLTQLLNERKVPAKDQIQADIYNALASIELNLGELPLALEHQLICLDILQHTGSTEHIPWVSNHIGHIYERFGKLENAIDYHKRALEMALQCSIPDKDLIASILDKLSRVYCEMGRYPEAENYAEQALSIWSIHTQQANKIARAEITKAMIAREQEDYYSSLKLINRAILRLDNSDDLQLLTEAYFCKGWAQSSFIITKQKGDYDDEALKEVLNSFNQSLELAEKYQYRIELPEILYHMSHLFYWRLDEKEKAYEFIERAYSLSQKFHDIDSEIYCLSLKATFDYAEGDDQKIEHYASIVQKYEKDGFEFPIGSGIVHYIMVPKNWTGL